MSDAQLAQIIAELKKIKNEIVINNATSILTDVTALDHTITNETSANTTAPVIQITTPNIWIDAVAIAIGWDGVAGSNYKFSMIIDGIEQLDTQVYKSFPIASPFNFADGFKVRLRPYTKITIRAYNYNSAAGDGHIVFFVLGDKIIKGDDNGQ